LNGERDSDKDKCSATYVGKVTDEEKQQRTRKRAQREKGSSSDGAAKEDSDGDDDDDEEQDLYAVLGLSQDGEEFPTERQIKKAFRKLSVKYHPDKNSQLKSKQDQATAAQRFKEISDAYGYVESKIAL
jgi:hypothetical protein